VTHFLLVAPLGFLGPVGDLFNLLIAQPMQEALKFIALNFAMRNLGIAIIIFTLLIKLVLSPLTYWGLRLQSKNMEEQAKLAPAMAALRKKYKKDPQRLQAETMKLYQEHGINPLGQVSGCLPLVVQMPVLYGLYFSLRNAISTLHGVSFGFLWVHSLANHGLAAAGEPVWFLIPLLCALTTWVQVRMAQVPGAMVGNEQQQQMTKTIQLISPAMIGYFAIQFPYGLGLYWLVSNTFQIIQQWFITGWGTLPVPTWMSEFIPPGARARRDRRR
jgi:YidC/Oxa1 family membrane protein insertase